jgi:hypothetical protein
MGAMTTKSGTRGIGPKQAARAFHAVRFATDQGRQLNLLITIDFTSLEVDEERVSELFRKVWSRVSRWWAYQRSKGKAFGPFDCYAVHENPAGGPRHVHWCVRAPNCARNDLETTVRTRLEKLTKMDCIGKALHFLEVQKPGGVAKYTLKGIHPAYASHFYMDAVDQGFVQGRRMTVSRSIGAAARTRAGWSRRRNPRA